MTDTVTVQKGQIWVHGSSTEQWVVISDPSENGDRIQIQNATGYQTTYFAPNLNSSLGWILIDDPNDPNLSEFIAQRCSGCGQVQGVVSREDIRNRKVARTTVCPSCDLEDPYDDDGYDEDYDDDN